MKKGIIMKKSLILILSLLLVFGAAACGTQSTAGDGSGQNTTDPNGAGADGSGLNTPVTSGTNTSGLDLSGGIGTDDSGLDISADSITDIFGMDVDDSSLSFSSLTELYNSDYRILLENILNEVFSEAAYLHCFITVEEPDTLIYNYQYTVSLSSMGLSHEEAAAISEANLSEIDYSTLAVNSIKEYQASGLPVRIIRLNYLDADGSLVYSIDYTESSDVSDTSASGTTTGVYADLADWMASSEDVALTVESTNRALASTGITFDLAVDGSVLVYQYYLPNGYFADGLAEEDLAAAFDSMVDAGSASVGTIISTFMEKYGLQVDAVRFAYYSKNGTELYSRDVTAAP
ncbi:MAG: DUF4854 domain-containing protein [Firmicutes bacterium]|nr:DUF4854 domain-containing protein [Bacillota bacterium]